MKTNSSLPTRNIVAKYARQFNKSSVIPDKHHNEFYDNLEIYEIIEFYDFPFIFTLKYTKKDKIYLQYFADEIKNKNSRIVEYYMVETNDNELKLLKENKITEFDIFKNSKDNVFVIHEEY